MLCTQIDFSQHATWCNKNIYLSKQVEYFNIRSWRKFKEQQDELSSSVKHFNASFASHILHVLYGLLRKIKNLFLYR